MHILDQEAPGLSAKLQSLSLKDRRRILANACRLASESLGDLEPEVQKLLDGVSRNNALSPTQVVQANALAEAADEEYFRLQAEKRPEEEWLERFFKARLLTAIGTGFGTDSWSDAADAVYELSKSRSDPSQIFTYIESEISSLRKTNNS